jgi:Asp-tRNA(Asn)/Glu-tRNA(Gln) amidotransferase A subunit family amidase
VLDYLIARDRIEHVASAFDAWFDQYDAILSPAALGPAPRGLGSTGNPLMQTVWTFAGLPALSLPLLTLDGGLPLGVQAVGPLHHDGRLLRGCRWLVQEFLARSQA